MSEIIKICKKHGKLTNNNIIKSGFDRDKQRYKCKLCMKEVHRNNYIKNKEIINKKTKEYLKANPEIKKESNKKWYEKTKNTNPEKINARWRRYRENNKDKILPMERKRKKSYVENLADPYIKHLLCDRSQINISYITQPIMDFKRALLLFKRAIKFKYRQIKKESNDED